MSMALQGKSEGNLHIQLEGTGSMKYDTYHAMVTKNTEKS
jgi:hypothetical protein